MKYGKHFLLVFLAIMIIIAAPVSVFAADQANGTLTDATEDNYTSHLTVSGNFDVTLSFLLPKEGRGKYGSFKLALYDGHYQEDAEHNAPNYLILRQDEVYLYNTSATVSEDDRWSRDSATWGDIDEKDLPLDTRLHLNIRRWDGRIRVTLKDDANNLYWNFLYKAKTDMADTLYLRLYALTSSVTDIQYTVGETDSFWNTVMSDEGWVIALAIVAVIVLVLISWIISKCQEDYFEGQFGMISGGLWGVAVLVLGCMFFPSGREFLNRLIHDFVGISWITFPDFGTVWFWIIAVLCVVYVCYIWYVSVIDAMNSPIPATLLMLVSGAFYAFAIVFLAMLAATLLLIVLGIAIFGGIAGAVGSSGDSAPAPAPEPEKEPEPPKVTKVWREDEHGNREYYKVGTSGEYYWDPEINDWRRIP